MAFLIFTKEEHNTHMVYKNLNQHYKLAGWGLIYALWSKKGKPLNSGYSLSADELLKQYNETFSADTHSLVIDFHPSAKTRIGLIEIEKIHLYTFGDSKSAYWSPMMLELRQVFYEDYENLSVEEKTKILSELEISPDRQPIAEFLYLNGDENSWNWGRSGGTNAAFINDEPRKYFKNFF
jgi:hypothetical protein